MEGSMMLKILHGTIDANNKPLFLGVQEEFFEIPQWFKGSISLSSYKSQNMFFNRHKSVQLLLHHQQSISGSA